MRIESGSLIGGYEIVAPLGAGGMGEVYRARDSKLERDVAIKVLSEDFADDSERLARFEREARSLAALNHPNIATVHGFELDGPMRFLVMELAQGEDLAVRLKGGPLTVGEAIPLFVQIAEGLEAAHEKGIIHRDLKPANIMVSDDGRAKILDFGLAKAMEPAATEIDLSNSPTMTAATMHGAILGTAAYMSPEQARGKPVDKRTDIWAFGVCLFEALTSQRAFAGDDVSVSLARVIEGEPAWDALPAATPRNVRRLIERCLVKDPRNRLRDIGDARLDLLAEETVEAQAGTLEAKAKPRQWLWLAGILGTLLGLVLGVLAAKQIRAAPEPSPVAFEIVLPEGHTFPDDLGPDNSFAVSPDGEDIVWAAIEDGQRRLYRRRVDDFTVVPIAGTEGGDAPFFSPDGQWIAFSTAEELRKVSIDGGTATSLAPVVARTGGHWAEPDWIYLAVDGSWCRLPARGGELEVIVNHEAIVEHTGFSNPRGVRGWKLPDGALLSLDRFDDSWLSIYRASDRSLRRIVDGNGGWISPDGTALAFNRGNAFFAAGFDAEGAALRDEPSLVLEGIGRDSYAFPQLAVGGDGTVVWAPLGSDRFGDPVFVDASGQVTQAFDLDASRISSIRFSPDGTKVTFDLLNPRDRGWSVNVLDLELRDAPIRVSGDLFAWGGVWDRDSRSLYFSTLEAGAPDPGQGIYKASADGAGETEPLYQSSGHFDLTLHDLSPDGRLLAFGQLGRERVGYDIYLFDLESRKAESFKTSTRDLWGARFSPDGRWLAYMSRTDNGEVYVASLADSSLVRRVSSEADSPVWSQDGSEIYFRRGRSVMAVDFGVGPDGPEIGVPRELFSGSFRPSLYGLDFDAKNERFLLPLYGDEHRPRIRVHRQLLKDWR